MDFVAIDFETANHRPDSACQLAAVVVRDSKIIDEHCWLIRPPSNQFSRFNIAVHGIRPADVAHCPRMDVIWNVFRPLIENQVLLAHNAKFDVSVLISSLARYQIACHDFDFQCTRALARSAWPGRPRYGLKPLGVWLGLNFKHHDALEDARVCAKIALAAEMNLESPGSLAELEKRLGVRRGHYRGGAIEAPRSSGPSARSDSGSASGLMMRSDRWGFPIKTTPKPLGSICPSTVRQACLDQPLAGKAIVMLGPLRGLSMEQTEQLLSDLGATVYTELRADVQYVVAPGIGVTEAQQKVDAIQAAQAELAGAISGPSATKEPTKSTVRVLSERQFRALLPGGAISTQ